ncbi:hypothetical protein OG948_59080 (plasmid) [Embleya sp. NBC_00888]|uniref:hypothetical protein n=1 Tax=Embleya sp. NBC_00888 TaxID=2975960 RepID=UPI002F90B8EF|nr:hypothetical protein OG948_59080 [Embleya sp. NBC_00888]
MLFLPRPPGPSTFTVRVESAPLPRPGSSRSRRPDALGTAHQWTANDPTALAERAARDLRMLLPRLTGGR